MHNLKLIELFTSLSFGLPLLLYIVLLLTKEKHNKKEYTKRVGFILIISHVCTLFTLPIYGNFFGMSSILLTSVLLGSLLENT